MYQNINRWNKNRPYINGQLNHDPNKKQLKKAPIERLLEQNSVQGEENEYKTTLNIFSDAVVEIVRDHLEDQCKEIARIAAKHAMKKVRATIMEEDVQYAITKLEKAKTCI